MHKMTFIGRAETDFIRFALTLIAALLLASIFAPSSAQAQKALPGLANKANEALLAAPPPPIPPRRPPLTACIQTLHPSAASYFLGVRNMDALRAAVAFSHDLREQSHDPNVVRTLFRVSKEENVDFMLLLTSALMESRLGEFNVAQGSSARGLFQYIEPTWLTLVHRYGEEIGLYEAAGMITFNRKGWPRVRVPRFEPKILALRGNTEIAARIKARQLKEEENVLRSLKKGLEYEGVTTTDYYVAHMLGIPLMRELYTMLRKDPEAIPAQRKSMREAAQLNRRFFYHGKRALTAREVMVSFEEAVGHHERYIRNRTSASLENSPCIDPLEILPNMKIVVR